MKYEWDENKRSANINKHGIDFVDVAWFDWETARETVDERRDYGETRKNALGCIKGRLMAMTYTSRGDSIRIISLRKANKREERAYYGT